MVKSAPKAPRAARAADLVWVRLTPQLPWWPARLVGAATGPTVAIEALGASGKAEVLRVQRRSIDRDFRGRLRQRSEPWRRRKCSGIKRSFGEAMAYARQLLGAEHARARCSACGEFEPPPAGAAGPIAAGDWKCGKCSATSGQQEH